MNFKPSKSIWARLTRSGFPAKVAESLGGGQALKEMLAELGYARKVPGMAARLSLELERSLPLILDERNLRAFGRFFAAEELLRLARGEAALAAPRFPVTPEPSSLLNPTPEQLYEAWPLISGQRALRLARAHRLTGDAELARAAAQTLKRTMIEHPPLMGLGWLDESIVALRAVNWLFTLRFLEKALPDSERVKALLHLRIMAQVLSQAAAWDERPAKNSEVDAAGALFFLGCCLPFLNESEKLCDLGRKGLTQGLADWQNRDNPLPTPRAARSLEWAGLCTWLTRSTKREDLDLKEHLRAMAPLLRAMAPPWASSQDPPHSWDWAPPGGVLGLSADHQAATSALNLSSVMFGDPDIRADRTPTEELFWLRGVRMVEDLRGLAGGRPPGAGQVAGAGLSFVSAKGGDHKISILIRTTGQGAISGADTLSLAANLDGQPFLVPPGPAGSGPLAQHLLSRAAHNALSLDRNLINPGPVEVESLEILESQAFFSASLEAFDALGGRTVIRRRIHLDTGAGLINLVDQIQTEGEHLAEVIFHLPVGAEAIKQPHRVILLKGKFGRVWLKPEAKARVALAKGRANPPLGWRALALGRIKPAVAVVVSANVRGSARISNTFSLSPL